MMRVQTPHNGGKEVLIVKNDKNKQEVCIEIVNLSEIEEKLSRFNELVKEANSLVQEMASAELEIKLKT